MEYAAIEWRDGQPYSKDFDDVYFSVNDGRAESDYVFLQQNALSERFMGAERFVIAETGFGTGLNCALTLELWERCAPAHAQLDYIGIDFAPLSPADIVRAASNWPELEIYFAEIIKHYPLPVAGRHLCIILNQRVRLHLVFQDVILALQRESLAVNAWFLDGFSPAKNPEIWNQHVYDLIAQNSAQDATLATFSAAGSVRRGLEQSGFAVEKKPGHGHKREMIVARLDRYTPRHSLTAPWYRLPDKACNTKHALIIGSGLAGLAVAWSLISRGWTITLIDRHVDIAAEASGNPLGLVLPRLSIDDTLDSQLYSAAFVHALARLQTLQREHTRAGSDHIWCGDGVYCAVSNERARHILKKNNFHASYLQSVENKLPGLRLADDCSLLFIPSAGWASPALICEAMRAACGSSLQLVQADVASIEQAGTAEQSLWKLFSAEHELLVESEQVVFANGVGCRDFEQTKWLPVQSARGQLTALTLRPGADRPDLAFSFEHFIAPSLCNAEIYYCGASYHLNDDCAELRDTDQDDNLKFVEEHFPNTFESPQQLSGRVGFRAVSEDRLPIVGPVPDAAWFAAEYHDLQHGRPEQSYAPAKHLPGLYLSAAHGSRGITSCFLAAEIIAAQLEKTPLPVDEKICAALNPARFMIRRQKRGV